MAHTLRSKATLSYCYADTHLSDSGKVEDAKHDHERQLQQEEHGAGEDGA